MTISTSQLRTTRSRAVGFLVRVRQSASTRHSPAAEIAGLTALYAVYEVARGARRASLDLAVGHALDIVALERSLHVFTEAELQHALEHVPVLLTVLAFGYPALHVLGTLGILTWVYRSKPAVYPSVRTALVAATGLALVGYVAFPVAPPRLARLGITDTVTADTPLNLSSSVLGRLYNPLAAVPSLHFAYALLMGTVLVVFARRPLTRAAGVLLPVVTLVVIVATGNHFFADAAAGGIVTAIGLAIGVLTCSSASLTGPRRADGETGAASQGR